MVTPNGVFAKSCGSAAIVLALALLFTGASLDSWSVAGAPRFSGGEPGA